MPDLPGCMADGKTVEEAILEARDAFAAWAVAEIEDKGSLLKPKSYSAQFVQRIPKILHIRLAKVAEIEGVNLNQLTASILAEGLGRRRRH